MDFSKFDLLEKKIVTLLDKKNQAEEKCQTLDQELAAVKTQLDQSAAKLAKAEKDIAALTEDRRVILEMVDSICSRLDKEL
jgi:chromosome segregation ATPase